MTIARGHGWRYDTRTGAVRSWNLDSDGNMRWADTGELLADQSIKGNADLVPAEHQTLGEGHE